jgi:CRISPR-associated protein Cas2
LVVVIYDIVEYNVGTFAKHLKGYGVRYKSLLLNVYYPQINMRNWLKKSLFIAPKKIRWVYKLTSNADVRAWGTVELVEEEEVVII